MQKIYFNNNRTLGCIDSNEAANFLESCNGDLEQAINLFFSQQSRRKQQSSNNSVQPSAKRKFNNRKTSDKE